MYENLVNIIKSIIVLYGEQEIKDYTKRLSKSHTFMESSYISANLFESYKIPPSLIKIYSHPTDIDFRSLVICCRIDSFKYDFPSLKLYYKFNVDDSCEIVFDGEHTTSIILNDIFNYEYNPEDFLEHKLKWIKDEVIVKIIEYISMGGLL